MADTKAKGFLEEESIKSIGTEERKVIFASSLGTVFEWYDFYLYATLAPFFAALFFPSGNDTAALLSAFATYAAGFLVRPFLVAEVDLPANLGQSGLGLGVCPAPHIGKIPNGLVK